MIEDARGPDRREPLLLIKWGGGLLTDKRDSESLDQDRLDRLSRELVDGCGTSGVKVVLGHGSGSFGHWSAKDSFLSAPEPIQGPLQDNQLTAIARTADAAGRLHRCVVKSLLAAGGLPFSWLPSSAVAENGRDQRRLDQGSQEKKDVEVVLNARPVSEALARGLLPVTMGDVVLSGEVGANIWSTERVLETLAEALPKEDCRVERVLWLGNTNGILDGSGDRIDVIDRRRAANAADYIGGSDGVDVTGGMRLRFETCRRLAASGIESWILDGREAKVLESALQGVRVEGTVFPSV